MPNITSPATRFDFRGFDGLAPGKYPSRVGMAEIGQDGGVIFPVVYDPEGAIKTSLIPVEILTG